MQANEIKVYSTSTCPYCRRARGFLAEKGVEFEEFDVLENQSARNEMIAKSGQMGVPVIIIDGQVIVGFNPLLWQEKLGLDYAAE